MPTPMVLPDTNFLIERPHIEKEEWTLRPLEIIISEIVLSELRGLSKSENRRRAAKALYALKHLEKLNSQADSDQRLRLADDLWVVFVPRYTAVKPPLDPQKPDHQLIAYARNHFRARPPRFCAILSADKELGDIAEALQLIVVWPGSKMHEELVRKHYWWTTSLDSAEEPARPQPIISGPQAHFDNFIHHLYGQVLVNRSRTVMAVAPMRARIALTTHIIRKVPNPESRVVLVVVESAEDAVYWAGQIRQQGGFSVAEVQIFGYDNHDQLEKAHAIIYRHDQVDRRLPRHLDRLILAQQKLTAVVDGCDLLSPVSLAHILFECDQFIGLTHYPLGYTRRPADRMLDAFLRGKAELAYGFADAERDGWGHSFDLYLRPVALTPEEQGEWDKLNSAYLRQRQLVTRQHPEFLTSEDFWQTLIAILGKKTAPEAGKLVELWEQREGIAQIADCKLETVSQLLQRANNHHSRRLIFDNARQWTPVLLNRLAQEPGTTATELPTNSKEQRQIWDGFADNRYNTLLFSTFPAVELPSAFFSHLIILTPLRPISEISRTIDWALTHTDSAEALRIDLLYVPDTPEEVAMFDIAEACFDLRYMGTAAQ